MPDDLAARPGAGLRMRAAFSPDTWNPEARTIDVVFTTGADVTRKDYWTGQRWVERLDVSEEAIDLSRLAAGAPVLDTHSSWSLGDVVGVVERAWIEGGKGYATLRFSDREEVAPVIRDVAAGILRNISVGYVVDQWQVTEASRDSAEVRIAKRWTPYEISLVPIPADPGAQVRAGHADPGAQLRAGLPSPPAAPPASQESKMTDKVIDPAADAAARAAEAATQAVQAERARMAEIIEAGRAAGLAADWAERHIGAGTSADQARKDALAEVAKRATPRIAPEVAGKRQDEGDTIRRLMHNAMEHRAMVPGVELEEGARQFRGFRMVDFARASIELHGGSARGMSPIETFQEAFRLARQARFTRATPAHNTGDFPDLLANTASKSLRQAYMSAPRSFVPWCRQVMLPDFKSFKTVALGGTSALAQIGEDAEITYGTLDDAAETWQLYRYGKALAISYVALINDDMSGFTRVPMMFGQAAARLESTTVYGILTANGTMADGNALIGAAHANTTTGALTADATGVANVGKVQALLRVQTAPNGDILGLGMRYLIVPSGKETVANQLFAPANVINTLGAVNPYRSSVEVIVEPRLDATSAVAFYGVADPAAIDTVHYGYLEGEAGPTISSEVEFDTDGMKTKVTHSFGAAAIDWRGIGYSTGA